MTEIKIDVGKIQVPISILESGEEPADGSIVYTYTFGYPKIDNDTEWAIRWFEESNAMTEFSVDGGKYTFRVNDSGEVAVLRFGEDWGIVDTCTKAVLALVHEACDQEREISRLKISERAYFDRAESATREAESLKLEASKLAAIEFKRGLGPELTRLREESRILSVILDDVSEALGAGDHESPVTAARRVSESVLGLEKDCVILAEHVKELQAASSELQEDYRRAHNEGWLDGIKRNADLLEQSRATCTRRTSELEAMRSQLSAALLRVSELEGLVSDNLSNMTEAVEEMYLSRDAISETYLPPGIHSATAIRTLWKQLQDSLLRFEKLRAELLTPPESEDLPAGLRRITSDDLMMSWYCEVSPTHYQTAEGDGVKIDDEGELSVFVMMDDGTKITAAVSVCAARAVIEAHDGSKDV